MFFNLTPKTRLQVPTLHVLAYPMTSFRDSTMEWCRSRYAPQVPVRAANTLLQNGVIIFSIKCYRSDDVFSYLGGLTHFQVDHIQIEKINIYHPCVRRPERCPCSSGGS